MKQKESCIIYTSEELIKITDSLKEEWLDKVKMKLLIQLNEIDKNCKKKGGEE